MSSPVKPLNHVKNVKTRAGLISLNADGTWDTSKLDRKIRRLPRESEPSATEGPGIAESIFGVVAVAAATVVAVTVTGGAIDLDVNYAGAEVRVRARGKS